MNWLNYQLHLMPAPDVILHIGAGLCSELPEYQQIEPGRIILVEPNPETFNALRQKTADCDNISVLQAAVAAEAGRARLRRFNFPQLDSLREPTGLYQLLPGLQQIGQTEVSTILPAQLVRRLGLGDSSDNWLVLEAPGEETAIVEELYRIGALQNFSHLIVRTGSEPFFEGDSSADSLLKLLESLGYFAESASDKTDPDWPRYHLKFQPLALKCRDLETRLEEGQQQLAKVRKESSAKTEEVDALKSRIAELEKKRDELRTEVKKLDQSSRAKIEALRDKAEEREQKLSELTEKAISQLDSNSNEVSDFFKQYYENQQGLEKRLLNSILPRIDNSGKQVEAYIGVQSFLQTGQAPPDFHGWPISPDLALFLVKLITANNYDLIIEFGSGSSTVLMAQALKGKLPRYLLDVQKDSTKRLERYGSESSGNEDTTMISNNNNSGTSNEILPRLIAFEHMRKYHEETSQMLKAANLEMLAEVIHSPLIPQKFDGPDPYLYYDVEETLEVIKKRLPNSGTKILALVDGPPGKTGPNARFPALIVLLRHFSNHEIEIILDDTKREEENEIVKKWKLELEKRGARFEATELPFEKGAQIIKYF